MSRRVGELLHQVPRRVSKSGAADALRTRGSRGLSRGTWVRGRNGGGGGGGCERCRRAWSCACDTRVMVSRDTTWCLAEASLRSHVRRKKTRKRKCRVRRGVWIAGWGCRRANGLVLRPQRLGKRKRGTEKENDETRIYMARISLNHGCCSAWRALMRSAGWYLSMRERRSTPSMSRPGILAARSLASHLGNMLL